VSYGLCNESSSLKIHKDKQQGKKLEIDNEDPCRYTLINIIIFRSLVKGVVVGPGGGAA
jgi:hypothetical protein